MATPNRSSQKKKKTLSENIRNEELREFPYTNDSVITAERRLTEKSWRVTDDLREGWLKGKSE